MRMRIQCGGTIDIDGLTIGKLEAAYDVLATAVPSDAPYDTGDSITFELKLVQVHNYPVKP